MLDEHLAHILEEMETQYSAEFALGFLVSSFSETLHGVLSGEGEDGSTDTFEEATNNIVTQIKDSIAEVGYKVTLKEFVESLRRTASN